MIIKKLYLTSFGKFKNKEIEFQKGINIIYGLNEAGKSTVHKFIEGMIFGFFKPGTSRRAMNLSHKQYKPRSSDEYMGSMLVEFNKKDYFIERNFSKTKPSIKIMENKTGKDITDTLSQHNGTKLPDVAAFLELDYTMFTNTISVSQMESETEQDLASVVVEKLTNLHTTKDESISLSKVNDAIENEKKEIGTKNSKSKPLYLTKMKIESLLLEEKSSQTAYTEGARLQSKLSTFETSLATLEVSLKQLDTQKSIYKNEMLKELYYKVEELVVEKAVIEDKISMLKKYHSLSKNDFDKGILLESKQKGIQERIDQYNAEAQKKETELEIIKDSLTDFGYFEAHNTSFIEVHTKHGAYTSQMTELRLLNEELSRLTTNKSVKNEQLKDIKEDFISYHKNKENDYPRMKTDNEHSLNNATQVLAQLKRDTPSGFTLFLFGLLCIVLIGIPFLIRAIKKKKLMKIKVESQEIMISEIQLKLTKSNMLLEKEIAANQEIKTKYGVSSMVEFEMLYADNSAEVRVNKANRIRIEEIASVIPDKQALLEKVVQYLDNISNELFGVAYSKELITEIEKTFKSYNDVKTKEKSMLSLLKATAVNVETETLKLNEVTTSISRILEGNNVSDFEAFKLGLLKQQDLEEFQVAFQTLETRIKDYLGEKSFATFKKEIDFEMVVVFDKELYETLLEKETLLRNEFVDHSKEKSSLIQQIRFIEDNNRDLALITTEVNHYNVILGELTTKRKALELAQQVLDELSEEISYEFAPLLNTAVSKVVSTITKGKYSDVKLDRNMDIKVFDNTTHKIESIYGFSKGTIDQVYLAMRLGINNVISSNVNPFILDDAFVNYDMVRLGNVLHIISEDAKTVNRQVLLFSCQNRETELLKHQKEAYHLISL